MSAKKTPFQIILFGLFVFFIIAGVLVFATLSTKGGKNSIGAVTLWGTLDQTIMNQYLSSVSDIEARAKTISYKQIPASTFQATLNAALADGTGPDLILITQSGILINNSKISPISFNVMSKRKFKDTFIDEARMFISDRGIIAMPFSVDPMVLYWNRDMFAEAGFATPPKFWDELFAMSERITKRDNANNINSATIAFGEFSNVDHAKDIISMLIMQAGGIVVGINDKGYLTSKLVSGKFSSNGNPTETALRFYTDFSNPIKNTYTWNRSLPSSLDAFAAGKLAMYLGYASEWKKIKEKNDNLNFDIASMPQIRSGSSTRVLTFGTLYALAVPRASKNISGSVQAAEILSSAKASALYAKIIGTPSPRRTLLGRTPKDSLKTIFRTSALLSSAWFDPNTVATDAIFRRMIRNITSGASQIASAVERASSELEFLLK